MRLVCDHHVPTRLVHALRETPGIDVVTVAETLGPRTDDADIVEFAVETDRVILTNDDDFFTIYGQYGLLVYEQVNRPAPTEVVAAVESIADAYDDHRDINEWVPDGWV